MPAMHRSGGSSWPVEKARGSKDSFASNSAPKCRSNSVGRAVEKRQRLTRTVSSARWIIVVLSSVQDELDTMALTDLA